MCVPQVIVPSTFKGLKSLEILDLHRNMLEVIGDSTFRSLKRLRVLDLHGNSIKYLAPDSFLGLAKLEKLHLQVRTSTVTPSSIWLMTAYRTCPSRRICNYK